MEQIRHEGVAQGGSGYFIVKEEVLLMRDKILLPPWARSTWLCSVFFGLDVHFVFHVRTTWRILRWQTAAARDLV